jgi:hypothetical protein
MARPPGNKMMKKPLALLGVLSLLLVACAQPDTGSIDKPVTDKSISEIPRSVLAIIDEARAAHQTAIEQDHAWTRTSQLLASARDKLAMGDESAARADAQRALFTADASVAQANREKNAWKGRVPHQL